MKRTPIISIGQVYLHTELNEYLVVTKSTRGDIQFKGVGFGGLNEVERFLERFGPVDPADLTHEESAALLELLPPKKELLVGWTDTGEDDESDQDE